MKRFKDLQTGQVFTFPSSRLIRFVKIGPLAYGSLEKSSVRPIALHGHQVYEIYKMTIARACQSDLEIVPVDDDALLDARDMAAEIEAGQLG